MKIYVRYKDTNCKLLWDENKWCWCVNRATPFHSEEKAKTAYRQSQIETPDEHGNFQRMEIIRR